MKRIFTIGFIVLVSISVNANAAQTTCREYTKNINIGGRVQQAYGKACLQEDGTWRIVSGDDEIINEQIDIYNDEPQIIQNNITQYRVIDERPLNHSSISFVLGNGFSHWGHNRNWSNHHRNDWRNNRKWCKRDFHNGNRYGRGGNRHYWR